MNNFFDKLKKGMNIKAVLVEEEVKPQEEPVVEPEETEEPEADVEIKPEEEISPVLPEEIKPEELEEENSEDEINAENASFRSNLLKNLKEIEPKKKSKKEFHIKAVEGKDRGGKVESKKKWFDTDGQLVVDVYETDKDVVIQSAIAGVKADDLDISVENDTVSIHGERQETSEHSKKNYFHKECYWGSFSREIILPTEVDGGRAEASMKNGVLMIRVPKIERHKKKLQVK